MPREKGCQTIFRRREDTPADWDDVRGSDVRSVLEPELDRDDVFPVAQVEAGAGE